METNTTGRINIKHKKKILRLWVDDAEDGGILSRCFTDKQNLNKRKQNIYYYNLLMLLNLDKLSANNPA